MKAKEHQQQLQMQQLHLMQQRNVHLQRRDPNHPSLGSSVNAMNMNGDGMMGKLSASSSTLSVKLQEEPMKHSHSMVSETSPALLGSHKMTLMKSATNQGLLIPGNSPNEIKQELNLGNTQKFLPTDPSSIYGQTILQSNSSLVGVGLNQGVTGLPLKGWPLTQSNRKRKQQHSSSTGPTNSSGTGNTPSSPASTHTPGLGTGITTTTTSLHHLPKTIIMYASSYQGTVAIASSTNQLDDIEHFGDDNVESFLQHERDGRQVYGAMMQHKTESSSSKGFSFVEVGCIRTRKKVLCCHFSSYGKLLASAGHNKKALLLNMDTLHLQTETTPKEHQFLITDIRFRPNST
ncbi:unnamed protein product [Lactuca saligna]|uniref:Uncharacterized protein n=1 Tax=Lactuca saligna TaxID=75948 RepID=A0AA36ELX0_LACSI|nr:unnamed protein product [Lactuca saligna]